MKRTLLISLALFCLQTSHVGNAQQRPVVQTKFTADPAPIVVRDRVYLFTSHDADDTPEGNANFKMEDWLLYSSTDLVNWQEHGSVADLTAFDWLTKDEQKNGAWAIQVVSKNGKYYMYAPIHLHGIGVLVSESLYGPWTDPIGKPLVGPEYDSIDPTVLIDDDGTACLYWGNPNLWYVKLNDDMISYKGKPQKDAVLRTDNVAAAEFGYQEGPWAYKRDGKYYMAYASTCCPEGIGWAWSDKPTDGWKYGGEIMAHDSRSNGNHPGIIDFKGKTYCFGFDYYLNWRITDKHHERRSVCLTELHFNPDGSINECSFWDDAESLEPVTTFYPYGRVEAETMAWGERVKTKYEKAGTEKPKAWQNPCIYLTDIEDGDYTMLRNVDFGDKCLNKVRARLRKGSGKIVLRLDSIDGTVVANIDFQEMGDSWMVMESDCNTVKGIHDLYFVFEGNGYEVDWWEFSKTPEISHNPIISTWYTPDPAPFVYGDTVYLFTDHDEDDAQYFKMKDWQLYSSTDMVNWTFRGMPLSTATFRWAKQGDNAWASQAIERDGTYYLEYAAGGVPEHLAYSTAESIDGPWTYRGRIMDEGVMVPTGNLCPFERVEAETMSACYGVKTDRNAGDEHWLTRLFNGSWTKLREVDFGTGIGKISARVRGKAGGEIEFLVDGKSISKINVEADTDWMTIEADADGVTGTHDVTILFRGGDGELFDLDWWQASESATYRNPIIYADVPDMSLCRAGDYFYLISTTMHLMPGGPIMRSKDMKNWETISYVFPRIEDGPRYSLLCDSTAYGQGQWASSIRYHKGRFYVWFSANGAPGRGFIYTAEDAAGEWTLLSRPPHFHDGSLLFDDDGRVYIFHGTGNLTELRADLTDKLEGGVDTLIFERDPDEQGLLEGSSVFKHNGKYYLMMISMDWSLPGRLRREVCYRSDCITGPYEKRVILETEFEGYGGVGQGCVVEGKDGEWYALIFQDRVGVGRVPCLMPCRWTDDGWPMLGDDNGNIPNNTDLPYMSLTGICGSDDFDSPELSLYWQWNHNPIDEAWSLTECPGSLRLTTARVVDNLYLAPNTLTQRMSGPECSGEICLYVGGMKDGDRAGLSAFSSDSGVMTVEQENGKRRLVVTEQNSVFREPAHGIERVDIEELFSVDIEKDVVYLRINGDFRSDYVTFEYSVDGDEWISVGRPVKMTYDYQRLFMGARFAIFNYATKETGGFVDVKSFKYDFKQ